MPKMPSVNKLVSYVGISLIVVFILALIIIDNNFPKDTNLGGHLKSIISNLLSSLITFLALYYFFIEVFLKKKMSKNLIQHPLLKIQ